MGGAEVFEFDAGVDGADGMRDKFVSGSKNAIAPNPYQHSELMRPRKCLRLKRAAA